MIITLTPETVLKAYEATGLQPIFLDWGDRITCGCAITAVLKHQSPDLIDMVSEWSSADEAADTIQAPTTWVADFVNGFDDARVYCIHDQTVYDLGQQCRAAVLAKYPDISVPKETM